MPFPQRKGPAATAIAPGPVSNPQQGNQNMGTDTTGPADPAIAFKHVGDMETPLNLIHDLFLSLHHVAVANMDEETGSVVMSLAMLGMREATSAEHLRGELFHLTRPGREHFERTGKVVPA
jgi:hypothetical protein